MIDPEDKAYMINMFNEKNQFGLPNPKLCEICPNCYRPYKIFDENKDVLTRQMFVFEIVSFWVFKIIVWPLLLIIFFVPALFLHIVKLFMKMMQKSRSNERKPYSATRIYRSEFNNSYREKVRLVSVQEEKMPQIVKRIDHNVTRLERIIKSYDETTQTNNMNSNSHGANSAPTGDQSVRADEIDKKLEKIRKDMFTRFDEFKKSLKALGVKTI